MGKNAVIALALLAAGFFAAYVRFRPYLGLEAAYTDGVRTYSSAAGEDIRFAVWDEPVPLSGDVNSDARERRPTLAPDGRFLVFSVGESGLGSDLFIADLEGDEPREPRPLLELCTAFDELAPAFSNDALVFATNRPGGAGGLDLWSAPYRDGAFGEPQPLGPSINTAAEETDPAPLTGERALAFASNRAGGFDLFLARPADDLGADFAVERLEPLATPHDEREPAFTADGLALFFASDRPGGAGRFDLWRSVLEDGRWLAPEPVPGVNTEASERGPLPSRDGFTLLFSADDQASEDLYRAHSRELFRLPGRPVGWFDLLVLATFLVLALVAWLAKRWNELEILYKCFLVSAGVHVALLFWFQHVEVEGGSMELPGRSALFQVRLAAASATPRAALREHGGELRTPQTSEPEAALPTRASPAHESLDLAAAPAATLEPSVAPAPDSDFAPAEPALQRTTERAFVPSAAVVLAERERAPSRRDRPAAPLDVVAQRVTEGGASSIAHPHAELRSRVSLEHASESIAPGVASGRELSLAPRSAPDLAPTDPKVQRTAERALVASPAVTLSEHERAGERREGAATPLDVATASVSSASSPSSARPRAEPSRAVGAYGEASIPEAPGPATSLELGAVAAATELSVANAQRRGTIGGPMRGISLPRVDVAQPNDGASRSETESRSAERDVALPSPQATALPDRSDRADRSAPNVREAGDVARGAPGVLEAPGAAPMAIAHPVERAVELRKAPYVAAAQPLRAPSSDVTFRERLDPVHDARDEAESTGREPEESGRARGAAHDVEIELATFGRSRAERPLEPTRHDAPVAAAIEVAPRASELTTSRAEADDPRAARKLELSPYRTRFGLEKEHALREHGGGVETEKAVEDGLAYLARIQRQVGSFGAADHRAEKYFEVAVGKTGLCLLAFLGAGHTPRSNTRYTETVERAVGYLLSVQDPRSGHFGYSDSYGHGVATYALAECYAITGEERLREPLERAVAHVLAEQRQDGGRKGGGWGYYYPDELTFDDWPRVSVTSWQVMALESARLGGLAVPDAAFERARVFLEQSYDERGWFRYSHDPARLNSGYPTLPGSTPAGLFALSLLGEDLADERWRDAVSFIVARTPDGYRYTSDDAFVFRARGNEYFWYYATLALFRHGGSVWERWNAAMKDTLLDAQDPDGSWRPISVYAGYAGDSDGDRSYTSAVCVLTLEVYYRYFTPLLRVD